MVDKEEFHCPIQVIWQKNTLDKEMVVDSVSNGKMQGIISGKRPTLLSEVEETEYANTAIFLPLFL